MKFLIYDFGISPIIWGIPFTEIETFAAKHTDYELRVWLQAELDKFARQTYIDLNINYLRFSEWYALQKSIGKIYIADALRTGKYTN